MNDLEAFLIFFFIFIPTAVAVVAAYDRIEDWWARRK